MYKTSARPPLCQSKRNPPTGEKSNNNLKNLPAARIPREAGMSKTVGRGWHNWFCQIHIPARVLRGGGNCQQCATTWLFGRPRLGDSGVERRVLQAGEKIGRKWRRLRVSLDAPWVSLAGCWVELDFKRRCAWLVYLETLLFFFLNQVPWTHFRLTFWKRMVLAVLTPDILLCFLWNVSESVHLKRFHYYYASHWDRRWKTDTIHVLRHRHLHRCVCARARACDFIILKAMSQFIAKTQTFLPQPPPLLQPLPQRRRQRQHRHPQPPPPSPLKRHRQQRQLHPDRLLSALQLQQHRVGI